MKVYLSFSEIWDIIDCFKRYHDLENINPPIYYDRVKKAIEKSPHSLFILTDEQP